MRDSFVVILVLPWVASIIVIVVIAMMAAMPLLALGIAASEVGGIVRAAAALVDRNLRIHAKRARALDAERGVVVDVFHRDDALRPDALLHPALERTQHVVLGRVAERRLLRQALAEGVRPGTAAAMEHARHHEQAEEIL